MIWLSWRQHRAEALAAALLIATVGVIILAIGLPMHAAYAHDGVAACLVPPPADDAARRSACAAAVEHFRSDFGYTQQLLGWVNLVPAAIGAFLGAPLLARELETGTWQLAWTQAVPRVRWLAVKLTALAGVAIVVDVALTAMLTWYRQPWDALDGRFTPVGFDLEGLTLPVYALFAFAAGTAASSIIRRSVPALAVAFAAFAALRYTVESWLRPHYQTPITLLWDPITQQGVLSRGVWDLSNGFVDSNGHLLTDAQGFDNVYKAALIAQTDVPTYLHNHGMRFWDTYQPADRFWTFQLIEAGIYLALITILLALVIWRVKRRII